MTVRWTVQKHTVLWVLRQAILAASPAALKESWDSLAPALYTDIEHLQPDGA